MVPNHARYQLRYTPQRQSIAERRVAVKIRLGPAVRAGVEGVRGNLGRLDDVLELLLRRPVAAALLALLQLEDQLAAGGAQRPRVAGVLDGNGGGGAYVGT